MNKDFVLTRYPKPLSVSKKMKTPFISNWPTSFLGFFAVLIILLCVLGFYFLQTKQKNSKNKSSDNTFSNTIHLELNTQTVDVQVPVLNWGSSKYTAIIIEPRKHKALTFVLQNYAENLDEDWNFILIHSTENESYVADIMMNDKMQQYKSRFSLIHLGINNMKISDYNCIFYNETFYDLIPTETFLIFQTDSMILRKNREKIKDFLKYDYVGAPWPYTMGYLGYMKVGNGGLSLRKKSKMLELLKYKKYAVDAESIQRYGKYIAEDQFFCGFFVKEVKLYKPYWEKAKEFSIESVFYDAPFGIHACWKGLSQTEMDLLLKLYPDINKLYILNY
jgi:hypothetical protein